MVYRKPAKSVYGVNSHTKKTVLTKYTDTEVLSISTSAVNSRYIYTENQRR